LVSAFSGNFQIRSVLLSKESTLKLPARNYFVLGCLLFGAWVVLSPALCPAQGSLGMLRVQVTDPSGSPVPGASVALSKAPAARKSAKTDIQGQYLFRNLDPGVYVIGVTAQGFAPYELQQYEVTSGRTQALSIPLVLAVTSEKVTVRDNARVDVDPSSNASALVLRKTELEALSDDPDDFAADLQALAGPAAGPNGGQIFVDGFTGGRLPAKQSIREVRINQNPFAAQFDRAGQGRIEVFTKPGVDEFHGQLLFQFSDAALNSRNPFVTDKPPYQRRQWEGEFTGPLNKKTSFFMDFERRDINENAFINALTLDPNLNVTPFSQAVVTPLTGVELNFRVDRQLTANHTLMARYSFNRDAKDKQGTGGFSLASRAYQLRDNEDTWQVVETGVLNSHTVNETRFRYRRQRTKDTGGAGTAPTIDVLDSFTGGGPPLSLSFNNQDRYELQNFTSILSGKHTIRWGGLMRGVSLADQTTQNYPGSFTFTSLNAYRATLLGLQDGLSAAQIRAAGGGASQFSISGGNPLAALNQFDFGLFLQDDWRFRPNLTLSAGLRYESQNHSSDRSDFGPRLGFAWGLGKATTKAPKNVVRGGFGIFYDRLNESLTLDALRLDGVRQQQFLIPFPDFYPRVPSIQSLADSAQPQAIRKTDSRWQAPRMLQAAIGFERQLPKGVTVSTNYLHSRGVHALRSRNINAPFPGIGAGGGPYGGVNSIYLYETSGLYRQNQLITNVNARVSSNLTLSGFYAFGYAKSDTDGAGSFPANQYNLSSEYGRAGFDVRHRLQFNGSVSLPWGFRISPFLTIESGRPYNITVGRDLNGDSLYNDRPAFATGSSSSSVVRTALGAFDVAPLAGQTIIPRNYADGPGVVSVNARFSKTFSFGEQAGSGGKKPSADPLQLTFTVNARNAINHPNFGAPDGNLSSPLFGHSTALLGGRSGGNRRLDLQVRFDF
jgi:hypothetical protein